MKPLAAGRAERQIGNLSHIRRAFSLLEVLLAMAILLGSLVILGHLASMGRKRRMRPMTLPPPTASVKRGSTKCWPASRPMESAQEEVLEDEPGWRCSVAIEPAERPGLASLRVTVRQDLPKESRAKQFTLVDGGFAILSNRPPMLPRAAGGCTVSREGRRDDKARRFHSLGNPLGRSPFGGRYGRFVESVPHVRTAFHEGTGQGRAGPACARSLTN